MTIKKGERFRATYNGKSYEVAGRWDSSLVLSPAEDQDDQCLIYTPGEIEELLETGKFQREGGLQRMRALFGRKVSGLTELTEITQGALKRGQKGQAYNVTREVLLDEAEFKAFADDFLNDQPWIRKDDGGVNKEGEVRCIRVINKDTGQKVLVNTEGYDYPRYTAIENC